MIYFFEEDILFYIPNKDTIIQWIDDVIVNAGYTTKEINYIFCSDEHLHEINLNYLDHDTLTDIITFDNSDKDDEIEGDIFISIPRVRDNAGDNNTSFVKELHRVMIHGVLHLLGHKDKTPQEAKKMRQLEDNALDKLKL